MSASNWDYCPACTDRLVAEKAAKLRAVTEAYGKVSIEEWDAMRRDANDFGTEPDRTFREDYEFYLEGTSVKVTYSGWCQVCHSGVSFTDSKPITIKKLS